MRALDLALEHAVADEATLLDALTEALAEAQSYRELAQAALAALADLTRTRERERQAHERLIAEYRYLREQILRDGQRPAA